jgi:hypothetical protein
MTSEESRHICFDYLVYGLKTIAASANSPFRFTYISGAKAERDQTKRPMVLPEFCLMRVIYISSYFLKTTKLTERVFSGRM